MAKLPNPRRRRQGNNEFPLADQSKSEGPAKLLDLRAIRLQPLVHSGASQAFVDHLESKRFDEVKQGFRRRAESGDIPGVGGISGSIKTMRIGRIVGARGFSKTNKNLTRRDWGKPAQFLDCRVLSAEFKIPAERQFSAVANPKEVGILRLAPRAKGRALCRY